MPGFIANSVRRILELNRSSRKSGPSLSPLYTKALEAHWHKKYSIAINLVSELLSEDPAAEGRFQYYRLWIESCAELGDRNALTVLRDHLFHMGQAYPEAHTTFFALRVIVHFELDEMEGAKFAAQALTHADQNPYVLEALQKIAVRLRGPAAQAPEESGEDLALLRAKTPYHDFFLWQTLTQGLLTTAVEEPLEAVLEHIGRAYPTSPLPLAFEYHRCIDRRYFAAAATVAERLVEVFPGTVDYLYYLAYAYFEDGDYPSARKVLHEANRMTDGQDAEIVGLLGHCHAKLGGAQEARESLKKAMHLLAGSGLPSSHMAAEYLDVQSELGGQERSDTPEVPREPQGWVIPLSPRRVHELLASPENVTDRLIRPMGTRAMPGDLCFLTGTSPDASQWNIIAVYAVESDPMWHPIHGHHSVLKKVTILPRSIPVDIQPMPGPMEEQELAAADAKDFGTTFRTSMSDVLRLAKRFGVDIRHIDRSFSRPISARPTVYQLDADALMTLEQVISAHRDDMVERRASLSSRRPTA